MPPPSFPWGIAAVALSSSPPSSAEVNECSWGSVVCIATRYGLDGSGIESRWDEISRTRPDRPWGPPTFLCSEYRVSFPGVKRPEPTPSSLKVKERVELYLLFPSGPSWLVLGRKFYFFLTLLYLCPPCLCLNGVDVDRFTEWKTAATWLFKNMLMSVLITGRNLEVIKLLVFWQVPEPYNLRQQFQRYYNLRQQFLCKLLGSNNFFRLLQGLLIKTSTLRVDLLLLLTKLF